MATNPLNSNQVAIRSLQVTVPGTPQQLPQYFIPDGMGATLTAQLNNTQNFYLGISSAATSAAGTRKVLTPGQSLDLPITSTDLLWIDADNGTDRVELAVFYKL